MLATVKGDVHDIGKNLVDIILSNNGYEVHNLGIKISITEMIDKALEVGADAIGMSGLLVKSTLIMRENLEELNARELSNIPVLLGGAALTRTYVERDLREVYDGRLFYGKDAFEGLHVMDRLGEIKRTGEDDPDFGIGCRAARTFPDAARPTQRRGTARRAHRRWHRQRGLRASVPGLQGHQGHLDRRDRQLGQRDRRCSATSGSSAPRSIADGSTESDAEFKDRIRPILREQLAGARAEGLLVPQVVYGYFPANADGDDLVIWTDESRTTRAHAVLLPAPAQGAVPVHRGLLPAAGERRAGLR